MINFSLDERKDLAALVATIPDVSVYSSSETRIDLLDVTSGTDYYMSLTRRADGDIDCFLDYEYFIFPQANWLECVEEALDTFKLQLKSLPTFTRKDRRDLADVISPACGCCEESPYASIKMEPLHMRFLVNASPLEVDVYVVSNDEVRLEAYGQGDAFIFSEIYSRDTWLDVLEEVVESTPVLSAAEFKIVKENAELLGMRLDVGDSSLHLYSSTIQMRIAPSVESSGEISLCVERRRSSSTPERVILFDAFHPRAHWLDTFYEIVEILENHEL